MISHGAVREWDENQGFGVIESDDTPGGCWVWHSSIVMDGLHVLTAGERVSFTYEAAAQDGYNYRAVLVWPPPVSSTIFTTHRSRTLLTRSSRRKISR